jgi:hypothetical protein
MSGRLLHYCFIWLGTFMIWSLATLGAKAETYNSSSGSTQATLTESCSRQGEGGACAEFSRAIRISRSGQIIVNEMLPSTTYTLNHSIELSVQDLDGDGEAEITVIWYAGGMGGLHDSRIYRYNASQRNYFYNNFIWRPSISLKDLDNDGISEFVTAESHGTSCTACRSRSLKVLRYNQGSMINVTAQFPKQLRDDAFALWKSFRPYQESDGNTPLPAQDAILAAYLADKYLLGEAENGWQVVAATGMTQQGARRIRSHLEELGYIMAPQGSQNAELRKQFGLIEATYSGNLQASSPVLRDGSHYGTHTFRGEAGSVVTVSLSGDFDTYLILVDANGTKIAENDDFDSSASDSRVQITLPHTGEYQIFANSYSSGATGSYWVTVRSTVTMTRHRASSQ